jgi:hypothetical protein
MVAGWHVPRLPKAVGATRADGPARGTVSLRLMSNQRWEYATVPLLVHATKQILDTWGEDGWELVAVVPGPNNEQLVAYFKRPKASA